MAELHVINRNDLFVIKQTDPRVAEDLKKLDDAYSNKMMIKDEERNKYDETAVPKLQEALRNVSNITLAVFAEGTITSNVFGSKYTEQGINQTSLVVDEIKRRVEEMSKGNSQYMDKVAESLIYFAGSRQTSNYMIKTYNEPQVGYNFINRVKKGEADYKDWEVHYDTDHATLSPEQDKALTNLGEFNKDQLKIKQNDAIVELRKMQADRRWTKEQLNEYIEQINNKTDPKDIDEYVEKIKGTKEDEAESQNGENEPENGEAEPQNGENEPKNGEAEPQEDEAEPENGEAEPQNGEAEPQNGENQPKKIITVNNTEPNAPEVQNSDDNWKKLRREEWERYAADKKHPQEFKLLSDDNAPDLNMSVGGTSIHYANEHEVTMANTDEYSKFFKLVDIEKQDGTDVINFGNITSEEYKSKLAAACLQAGLEMSGNYPKHIDLNLACFKTLDDATKQKIEAYNQEQAAKEQSNQSEQGNESKPEPTPVDTKNKTKEEYQKLYEAKLAELKAKKDNGESVDFSAIEDPVDRIFTYAAAKENKLKIENLNNNEFLIDNKQHGDRQGDITTALNALPKTAFDQVDHHEKRVKSLRKIKRMIKKGELNEGEYSVVRRVKGADGKDKLDDKGNLIYELDENGNKIYDRYKSQLNTYKDGKKTKINREDVEYTTDKDGRRNYQYTIDEQTKLRIYKNIKERENRGH